jgi:cyanophycin synthetase
MRAMVDLVDRLDVEGKRMLVYAAPGDRRDEDIAAMAEIAAGHFDRYIVRRDDNPRGRGQDEVPRMLRDGLLAAGVSDDAIEVIPDEVEATDRALQIAAPGDLVILLADNVRRSWEQVVRLNEDARRAKLMPEGLETNGIQEEAPAPVYTPAAPVPEAPSRARLRIVHQRPEPLFAADEEAD